MNNTASRPNYGPEYGTIGEVEIVNRSDPLLSVAARAPAASHTPAYLALAAACFCIGMSAIFIKWAGVAGPVAAVYRVGVATLALTLPFAWGRWRGGSPLPRRAMALALLSGVWFAGDLGIWSEAVRFTSAANATLLGNLAPLWVALGALVLWRVRLRRIFWAGLALAFGGGIIVVSQDLRAGADFGYGDALAVTASIFYAGYMLNTQHSRRTLGTMTFMWFSVLSSTVILLAVCLALGLPLWDFSLPTYAALVGAGLVSQVGGYLAINYALGHLPAPLVSVTLLGQPVITALLAVPLLGEGISLEQAVGGLIVLTGIYLANRQPTTTPAPVDNPAP
jgi:drug/metabolite transporter (DMT)-like permease